MTADREPRIQRLWDLGGFGRGRGLELGPLHNAIVPRDEADVAYADVLPTDELRAFYADDASVDVDLIPHVDHWLIDRGRVRSLAEAVAAGGRTTRFDWVVASHVIEHVPDLIGWLHDVAEVTVDGGTLVLAVPDCRWTFDLHRPLTTVGQMIEAHERRDATPTTRAVYDHFEALVVVDTPALWAGEPPPGREARMFDDEVLAARLAQAAAGTHVDCHVWMFTPEAFVRQLAELRRHGRSDWYVEELQPTPHGDIEFLVRMRRLARSADRAAPVPAELVGPASAPEAVRELNGARARVAELEQQVAQLRSRVRRQRRRIARIEESGRWRVGGWVLAPVRAVRRRG